MGTLGSAFFFFFFFKQKTAYEIVPCDWSSDVCSSDLMALGDYSNSRGAADMGLLPDRFPGYAHVDDVKARESFEQLWGCVLSSKPGMSAPQIVEAAQSGNLK